MNEMVVVNQNETASVVLAAQAKALVEARYLVAMKNPRDLDLVRENILKECRRPKFAEVAIYKKPIGKVKNKITDKWEDGFVEGPSIRFVETAIRNMKNIVVDAQAIFDDAERKILRVTVTDVEANISYNGDVSFKKQLERKKPKDDDTVISQRTNSKGDIVYLIKATDEQIADKENAQVSKKLRTLGLRLIPGDIVEEAIQLAYNIQAKADAADPELAKKQLFDAFSKQGVTVTMLKEHLGHDGTALNPKEMADLRSIFNAIKDGETTWREVVGKEDPKDPDDDKKPDNKKLEGDD